YDKDILTFTKLVVAGKEADTPLIKITVTGGLGKKQQLGCQKQLYLQQKDLTPKTVQETFTPQKLNQVVPCAISVKAGEHLGYAGLYETPTENGNKNSKHLLHFEIFTDDEQRINDFLDNKAKVNTGRKYLKVNKRSFVIINTEPKNIAINPANTLPPSYFNAGSLNLIRDWIVPMSEVSLEEETQGTQKTQWYKLPVGKLSGAKLINDQTFGWVRKGVDNEELCQYDLRKLGFKVIEEEDDNTNGDMFVDAHNIKGEELKAFFEEIIKKIDELGNNDGKVTANEVQQAYKDAEISEGLQKIVGYHPTEWQKNKIDPIEVIANRIKADIERKAEERQQCTEEQSRLAPIENYHEAIVKEFAGEDTLNFLKREKERIGNLVFWDEVPELKTPKVWHFHPVRFIKQLSDSDVLCKECGKPFVQLKFLKEIFPKAHAGFHEDFIDLTK
ncbi:MAG: hypothetical protein ACRCWR_10410, partial [Saezia sp.]